MVGHPLEVHPGHPLGYLAAQGHLLAANPLLGGLLFLDSCRARRAVIEECFYKCFVEFFGMVSGVAVNVLGLPHCRAEAQDLIEPSGLFWPMTTAS